MLGVGGLGVLDMAERARAAPSELSLSRASEPAPGFKLGFVTYNLAKDLDCLGAKVRPNGFAEGVPREKTLEQIGRALAKCGNTGRDFGVEIWLEVHGPETQHPPNTHRIMKVRNQPAVGLGWNSNDTDVVKGSVKQSFDLM
jgi:hypothetical protein